MNRAAIIACCLLPACAHETTISRTATVEVPVAVPCKVEVPTRPAFALSEADQGASIFDKVKAALVEISQRRAYEAQLEAALAACR